MPILEKMWDDVMAGPQPNRGLGKFRKITVQTTNLNTPPDTTTSPATPSTPTTPVTAGGGRKDNVWRSVFHPGSNINAKNIGAHQFFDKPCHSDSPTPTVYDWLYSGETRSKHV